MNKYNRENNFGLDDDAMQIARTVAKEDFYFYSRWMFLQRKGYKWLRGPHHKIICDALMKVYTGECKRLIINVAPRYSKTELAVINFISWTLGQVPDAEFIHTSYSGRLATNNSWQTKNLVQHEEFSNIFRNPDGTPAVTLRTDSQAKDEWRTNAGGCMYAVGAGGTITGYGAGKLRDGFGGAIVIDDPHKADEARSDVVRGGVIDWFQDTLESRCNSPSTPIILIMQRLHEMDLAGWLLSGGNGESWDLVCLETLLENDTHALWDKKHTVEDLLRLKKAKPYTFSGQYQQSPCAAEGNIYKPDNIKIIDAIPNGTRFVRGWDLGSSEGEGDYTVGFKLGEMPDGRFIIADIVRDQLGPEGVEALIKTTTHNDGRSTKVRLPQDPGQAGVAQKKNLAKLLKGYVVSFKPTSGDKIVRSEPFAAQINVGNVVALRGTWFEAMKTEMKMFPNGDNDDIEDAGADAFNELTGGSFFDDCETEEEAPR